MHRLLALTTVLLAAGLVAGCSSDKSHQPAPSSSAPGPATTGAASPGTAPPGGGTTAPSTSAAPAAPGIGQVFPPDNAWNTDVSGYPVHPDSDRFLASIGLNSGLHADFGTTWNGAPNGIPYVVVPAGQRPVPVRFVAYPTESDPGPYPIPTDAPIEGGPAGTGDRHVIVVDPASRRLYELFRAFPDPSGGWTADSGAVFDLDSNALRPAGWTSADAAGLPIFPGLVRYDEAVVQGRIGHALRFTVARSQRGYIEPARHFASSSTDPALPPMGLRVRLKAGVSTAGFPPEVRVILEALKTHGMIVADNGSNWFVSGAPDPRWSDGNLATLSRIKGSDFEVVYTGPIVTR